MGTLIPPTLSTGDKRFKQRVSWAGCLLVPHYNSLEACTLWLGAAQMSSSWTCFFIFMRMSLGKVEISRLHGLGEEKLNFVRKKKKKSKEIAQDKKKKRGKAARKKKTYS